MSRTPRRPTWRLAMRLARREVARRPSRAVLVLLLVVVPVFAITVTVVLVESSTARTSADAFRSEHGGAETVIGHTATPYVPQFVPPLPAGSVATRVTAAELPFTPDRNLGLRMLDVQSVAGGTPIAAAGLELVDGRVPDRDEVAVSQNVAEWLGVGIGDRAAFTRPEFRARVAGIVRAPAHLSRPVMLAPGFDWTLVRQPGVVRDSLAVRLPAGYRATTSRFVSNELANLRLVTPSGTRRFPTLVAPPGVVGTVENQTFDTAAAQDRASTSPGSIAPETKFWSWVAIALVLAMAAVIIAAAFATTARRQLVVLGQLSANGADPRFLRRSLTLQGTILGVLGGALGIGAAAGALLVAHGWIEARFDHTLGYVFSWDLVAIGLTAVGAATIAARFPARTASRVPVLAALAGRRPLPPVPRLQWLKAAIVFVTGVGMLLLVSLVGSKDAPRVSAAVAILGGLFVLAGAMYMTPVVVTVLARVGSRMGAAPRLASRSLVRVRSRSAAIVASIAVAGALAVAVVTSLFGLGVNRTVVPDQVFRPDEVTISAADPSDAALAAGRDAVDRVLPGVRYREVRGAFAESANGQASSLNLLAPQQLILMDRNARSALRVAEPDRRALDRGQILMVGGGFTFDASGRLVSTHSQVSIDTPAGSRTVEAVSASTFGAVPIDVDAVLLVPPARFRELGLDARVIRLVGTAPHHITGEQRIALTGEQTDPYTTTTPVVFGAPSLFDIRVGYDAPAFWRGFWSPGRLELWFAAGALVFVLFVVAIGLLLGSAEGRDEREVLDALGARPRTERRIGATKALVLALAGAILAVPTGFVPLAVVFRALQEPLAGSSRAVFNAPQYPVIRFPWVVAIGLLVVVPLVALAASWIATGIAQRTRPLRSAVFGSE